MFPLLRQRSLALRDAALSGRPQHEGAWSRSE